MTLHTSRPRASKIQHSGKIGYWTLESASRNPKVARAYELRTCQSRHGPGKSDVLKHHRIPCDQPPLRRGRRVRQHAQRGRQCALGGLELHACALDPVRDSVLQDDTPAPEARAQQVVFVRGRTCGGRGRIYDIFDRLGEGREQARDWACARGRALERLPKSRRDALRL